jgi:hypothetical protein
MKLEFKDIEKGLLEYNAKSEYKQAAIIMVRNIFKEAESKQLELTAVSHQRELLIAFFESVDEEDMEQHRNGKAWKVVDHYLKAINCG